jgi:hypothetical protein
MKSFTRRPRFSGFLRFVGALVASAGFASGANAQALTWQFDQIFSDAAGVIQFIVLHEFMGQQGQDSIQGSQVVVIHLDTEHAHTAGYTTNFTFPINLPEPTTAGRRLLVATQSFANLGLIQPDFIVDDIFLPSKGGALSLYRSSFSPFDAIQYPALPSDGVTSLYRNGAPSQNLATNFAGQTATVPLVPSADQVGQAVEYYYADWDYYFETSFPDEQAVLDGGAFGGVWKRTGQKFNVWTKGSATTPGACRFFSTSFAPKSSHFYTPSPEECASVKVNPDWQFEAIAFYVRLMDADGNCQGGTIPLYRLYNNGMGGAPNHRYTTDINIFNQMTALGWVFEGNGNTKTFACVPA